MPIITEIMAAGMAVVLYLYEFVMSERRQCASGLPPVTVAAAAILAVRGLSWGK